MKGSAAGPQQEGEKNETDCSVQRLRHDKPRARRRREGDPARYRLVRTAPARGLRGPHEDPQECRATPEDADEPLEVIALPVRARLRALRRFFSAPRAAFC